MPEQVVLLQGLPGFRLGSTQKDVQEVNLGYWGVHRL